MLDAIEVDPDGVPEVVDHGGRVFRDSTDPVKRRCNIARFQIRGEFFAEILGRVFDDLDRAVIFQRLVEALVDACADVFPGLTAQAAAGAALTPAFVNALLDGGAHIFADLGAGLLRVNALLDGLAEAALSRAPGLVNTLLNPGAELLADLRPLRADIAADRLALNHIRDHRLIRAAARRDGSHPVVDALGDVAAHLLPSGLGRLLTCLVEGVLDLLRNLTGLRGDLDIPGR